MDPDWLASLYGPGALDTSPLVGGTLGQPGYATPNNLYPWLNPGAGGSPVAPPVPSGVPTAPGAIQNPPAMPPAIAPAAPTALAGLQNKAPEDPLVASLRGIRSPEPPVAQKVTTPHPPPAGHAQALQIANLLASLGIGPSRLPTLSLPRGV